MSVPEEGFSLGSILPLRRFGRGPSRFESGIHAVVLEVVENQEVFIQREFALEEAIENSMLVAIDLCQGDGHTCHRW